MKSIIRLPLLFLVSFSLFLSGCNFTEVDNDTLKNRLDNSNYNSAVSFWYLGEKDGYHYIIEKWPTRTYRYKIKKEYLRIDIDNPLHFTTNRNEWINLGDLHFKAGG